MEDLEKLRLLDRIESLLGESERDDYLRGILADIRASVLRTGSGAGSIPPTGAAPAGPPTP